MLEICYENEYKTVELGFFPTFMFHEFQCQFCPNDDDRHLHEIKRK